MGALAHQTALVQHQDLVCVQHGGDALCHDDDGGVVGLGLQGAAQGHVGLVVQGRETVVEQINFGVLGNGACNGKALLLAAGHVAAHLRHMVLRAVGELVDKLLRLRKLDGLRKALIVRRRFALAKVDIVADAAGEEHRLLRHVA